MAEFFEAVHQRGQQTLAVWNTHAATFQVGALTLAAHTTDVALLMTHVNDRDVQQDVQDDAVLARDANFGSLRDIVVRVPQLIEATLEDDDRLHSDLDDVFAVDPNRTHGGMERARRVVSLWNRVNILRAAMTPALPALTLGATTVANLQTLLTNHPGLLQTVEDERSELNQKTSLLKTTSRRIDRNNKRWYAAWSQNFAIGSPENDALSQIDTGPTTPAPSALKIDTLTAAGTSVQVAYVAGGGDHATTLVLLWRVVGIDPDFGHATAVNLAGQTIGPFSAGDEIQFKTRGSNSTGDTDSTVKSITL
ncbi:MAG: hypothetical protein DWI21_16470 [Planctomycetota bacterium]|nr:MAG: hypothetical protein DWI21_16470 [Planctomycetota bacterium]